MDTGHTAWMLTASALVFFIKASLENGDSVKLSGFGNFDLRTKSERPGRNPKTGKEIPIKARSSTLYV